MPRFNVKYLSKIIFLIGLFLLPLVFWPKAYIAYEIPKVWFFQRWVEILGVLGVLGMLMQKGNEGNQGEKGKRGDSVLIYLVFFFVLTGIVSSILGVNFVKSLVGNYYRMDGLLTLLHLAAFFFFLVLFWEKSWEKGMAFAITGGSLFASLWTIVLGVLERLGILGVVGGSIFGGGIGATFGNPNFLAGYLLVSLPFTIFVMKKLRVLGPPSLKLWRVKILGVLGILGQIVAIILTGSIAGIIGILLLGVGYLWGRLGKSRVLKGLVLLSILSILGYLSYLSWKGGGTKTFPESRQRIIIRGFNGFLKRPVFGWGVANFDYAFESNYWPIKFNNDVYVDKAHGNLLEILVTEGVVGFGIYCLIILGVLRGFRPAFAKAMAGKGVGEKEKWQMTLLLALLLFLFHSQTNIISINEEMLFWAIAGISVGQNGLLIEAESDKINRHEINKTGS